MSLHLALNTGLGRLRQHWRTSFWAALLTCSTIAPPVLAQQTTGAITPNYKDADLTQITEAVAAVTGKTFIIDPRVKAQVTMLSSTPMSPNAFYQAYLSILQVYGYVAVTQGNIVKIIPDANARQMPDTNLTGGANGTSDEMVTQIVDLRYTNAATLSPVLRPLISTYGNLAQVGNQLIITDRAANVSRILRIVQRIDQQPSDNGVEIVQLQNATAAETIKVLNTLNTNTGGAAQANTGAEQLKIVADDRTNSIIISGDEASRLRIKTLVTYLDTPLQTNGNVTIRYLHYADAETLAKSLKEQIQGITQATSASAAPGGAPATASSTTSSSNTTSIWADKNTNALVIAAAPKVMQQINTIVDKLDIRRAQVHVEAIVVEVNDDKAAELGVNWALYSNKSGTNVPVGVFNAGSSGSTIADIGSAVVSGDYSAIPNGTTFGIGKVVDSGLSFAAILRLLRSDSTNNIISTPSIVTLDNEEATIEVAKEVPYVTGQYTSTGTGTTSSTTSSSVNPFQTISRESVGTKLKLTPQISEEGGAVLLKISQEASSIDANASTSVVNLVTNKRTISTSVMVENGGMIVLGGLLDNTLSETNSRVPILGSIPIIGNLFKARSSSKSKRNLMVFIHPTVIRSDSDSIVETNSKYNTLRNMQMSINKGKASLLPGEKQPTLPELPEKPAAAPGSNQGTDVKTAPLDDKSAPTTP
jgi:general secretion pathway protein D